MAPAAPPAKLSLMDRSLNGDDFRLLAQWQQENQRRAQDHNTSGRPIEPLRAEEVRAEELASVKAR